MNRLGILLVTLALLLSFCYTYQKGCQDGEQTYKHSHRMYKALESAYKFGYEDCKNNRCESWEGDCE